jgi:Zn-dependent protease with chaperone function
MRAAGLILGPPAVLAGLGAGLVSLLFLPWYDAPVVLLVVAALVAVYLWQRSTTYVESRLGARAPAPHEHPRLANLAEGLSAATGTPAPRLLLKDSPAANAAVFGRTDHGAVMVVTTGLLERLDVVGLEGVLAHLYTRWRSGRPRVDTLFAHVAGTVYAPLPGLAARLGAAVLGPGRDMAADLDAVRVTRYPPGLDRALAEIQGDHVLDVPRALGHLWLVPPVEPLAPLTFTLDERIAVLREL